MRLTSTGAYARPQPVPKMPAGLVELMEDLTRDVLRHNPDNVYEFCAAHMEKLLEIRDGRASKPALTLEQKIARVQEKINKKAELRRQKYDKQMQLYRLNSKLEQRSEQQNDQMRHSNVVEDKSRNSLETQTADKIKQSTAVPEESQNLYSNTAKNESKDSVEISHEQEPSIKNNVEEFLPKSDEEEIETEELENTDFGRVIDIKIESTAETKDSVEPDSDNQNKSEEPIIKTMIEFKSISDEVDHQPKNFTAESPEQGVQVSNDILQNKNDISDSAECESTISMDNDSDKNITKKQTLIEEFVAENPLKEETSYFDVLEDPKNSIEKPVEEVIETISKKNEFMEENVAQDETAVTNAVDDESKGPVPVHHEQDLVNALEVEIFHEPRELNKGSKKGTIDTQEFDAKLNSRTSFESDLKNKTKDEINEGQYSANKNSSFSHQDLPSYRNDEENLPKTTSSANFKSHSVDDHIKVSEVNSFKCTDNNVTSSEIEAGNNISKLNVSGHSELIAGSHVNPSNVESNIYNQFGTSSGYNLNSEDAEVSVIDREEVNNENNVITEKVSPFADERVQEHLENIPNNRIPNTIEDVQDPSSDNGVIEILMQKKEYALLLPETSSDNIIEPTTLRNTVHEETLSGEKIENNSKLTETGNFKDENVETNTNKFAAGITETDVAQTTEIKEVIDSSVDYVQELKNIDKSQEKCENILDNIENKLIENSVGNITQRNFDSHIEIISEVKEQNTENKEHEQNELMSTNNDIKIGSETANLEERSGDAEENMSYNSELSQKTETPHANDSADESTIGDSNDSLMDQEVEIITRSKENNMTPSIMDLETAAVTIQKVFRTFLFKSRCSTFEDTSTDEANPITDDDNEKEELEYPITKERRPLGISRMDTVLQTVNEEKSLSLSTDDSSTLSSAATVIQAQVRGFLARNKFNSHKTTSNASLVNSDGPSAQSFEADEQQKKTVLNIHIIPEGDHFLSRDESLITSMDLSLDGTPPSSVNLHPLGYDKSEPRKQLKREDAFQSVSPPSNNSGKLSEDVDSIKEMVINDLADAINVSRADTEIDSDSSPTKSNTLETVVETGRGVEESSVSSEPEIEVLETVVETGRGVEESSVSSEPEIEVLETVVETGRGVEESSVSLEPEIEVLETVVETGRGVEESSVSSKPEIGVLETVVEKVRGVEESSVSSVPEIGVQEADLQCKRPLTKMSSDEGDVVTPFEKDRLSSIDSDRTSCLLHSGEFHDIVLPTKVIRSDTSVVRGE